MEFANLDQQKTLRSKFAKVHFFILTKKKLIFTSVNQFKVRDSLINIPQTICYKIKVGLSYQIGAS